jgi:hypothetical protein
MNGVVAVALKQRVLMVALMLFVFVAGFVCFSNLNIEAYPDPVPPRVEVITQNQGASAEEIERYITIPVEIQMTGIRHVRSVRTISLFGLSDVRVEFTYGSLPLGIGNAAVAQILTPDPGALSHKRGHPRMACRLGSQHGSLTPFAPIASRPRSRPVAPGRGRALGPILPSAAADQRPLPGSLFCRRRLGL